MRQVKKILCGLLIICLVFAGIVGVPQTVKASSKDFVIDNGVLKKYQGSSTNVTIPKGVKEIGGNAFAGNTTIVSVVLPNGVSSIDAQAFYGCTNLSNITIPKTVTRIDYFAFSDTKWLEQKQNERKDHLVIINNKILYDGSKSRGAITIPEGITLVCPYAFYYNDNITSIVVPKSVKICDTRCFGGCTSLKTITFKNKNTKMNYDWGRVKTLSGANGAFYGGDYYFEMLKDVKAVTPTLTIKGYSGSTAEKTAKSLVNYPWGNQQVKFVNLKTRKVTSYGIPTQLTIKKGKSTNALKINYNENYRDSVDISYKSSNKKVATINADGKLTAKKKGTSQITIKVSERGITDSGIRVYKTKVTVK